VTGCAQKKMGGPAKRNTKSAGGWKRRKISNRKNSERKKGRRKKEGCGLHPGPKVGPVQQVKIEKKEEKRKRRL